MKFLALFVFLVFPIFVSGQDKETAVGTYSERGNLISVTNLTGLSDCSPASVSGKVDKVKVGDSAGRAMIRTEAKDKDSNATVEILFERLTPPDRIALFKHLVRKKITVRIAGYRCKCEGPITAFSIDRVY
jgi:hypothetical protein